MGILITFSDSSSYSIVKHSFVIDLKSMSQILKVKSFHSIAVCKFHSDGASKSGLFAVMWCVLERIKSDREVAIADITRMVRQRRPQAITGFVSVALSECIHDLCTLITLNVAGYLMKITMSIH